MADAWGGSWGASWGVSWGYSAAVAGGGAGGGHGRAGRQFPFRNRYDDPDLFRQPPPAEVPEQVVDQPYVEGDPVQDAPARVDPIPLRRAPPAMGPIPAPVIAARPTAPKPQPPPPDPATLPLSDEEEREEEEAVMRVLGFFD